MTGEVPSGQMRSRQRRPSTAYAQIKEAIIQGVFQPGESLVESAIAEWCGVSRTPVREALLRLEHDGLVERSEHGIVVRTRSPEEILDIYEVRVTLEVAAARTAAERRNRLDVVRLQRMVGEGKEVDPHAVAAMTEHNRAFHRTVWQATHNEALKDLLERLDVHVHRYPATTLSYPGRWEEALKQHEELADLIIAKDAEKASALADLHFSQARDIRLSLWDSDLR